MSLLPRIQTSTRKPLIQTAKAATATILAWYISVLLLPNQFPIFAAAAALLVVQPSVNQSLGKGIERSFGVLIGVVIGFAVGYAGGQQDWTILLASLLGIAVSWVFRLTPGSAVQISLSAMLVLAIGNQTPQYALDRVIETVIGAVIGIAVNVAIVPPVALAPLDKVSALALETAAGLERLAEALTTPQTPESLKTLQAQTQKIRPMEHTAREALKKSEESLSFNPRRSRHREAVEEHAELLGRLRPIDTRTLGMTRAFCEHYDDTIREEPTLGAIAEELRRAAHDLTLLVRRTARDETEMPPMTSELPALTGPLAMPKPHPHHWILIGSLLEDLRRVREEIVGE